QNRIEYNKLKETWNYSKPVDLHYELSEEEEWNKLNTKLAVENYAEENRKSSTGNIFGALFSPKLKNAFAFGTALVVIVSAIFLYNNYNTELILKTITTTNMQKLEVELPDGSIANLNSGSKIEFYENFEDDKREVTLEGEAFFSVKKDGRPFTIKTDNAITKVLGTKFNVWARAKETRVIVKEGKVSLAENKHSAEVILTPGESSKVVESNAPVKPIKVDPDYLLGWLNDRIVFSNTNLQEISKELERKYNVQIDIVDPELLEYNLTGTFENEKIDTVLTKICLALNLKYSEQNNKYKVTK
ncbi:MAG: FecR domain-containing protein, partial [Melioribacteraceae bacterium]|nr:FecR domain-containing protein [Melioribacteraceae bacterium]